MSTPRELTQDEIDEDMFPDDDNEYDLDIEDDFDECGMMPNGQCTMAGSEWCDWDCPRDRPVKRRR